MVYIEYDPFVLITIYGVKFKIHVSVFDTLVHDK